MTRLPMPATGVPDGFAVRTPAASMEQNSFPSPLRPVVDAWLDKINLSKRSKIPFHDIGVECEQFYSAAYGFMWDPSYRNKFNQSEYGPVSPRFPITIAKAFELVAIFGPTMYAQNPVRTCTPRMPMDINPAAFGDPNDPQVAQMLQQLGFAEGQRHVGNETRATLMSEYLNYTPNELPGGGLKQQAENSITEGLVKGRGLLWTELWQPPGSRSPVVGSFYDSVDHLFLDPDAEHVSECRWVCRRVTEPRWKAERRYNLPEGALKSVGDYEQSQDIELATTSSEYNMRRKEGTADLVTYYKVWSKMGIGKRLKGTMNSDLVNMLDKYVGDHVYLVVAEGVPYPLNLPPQQMMQMPDEQIVESLSWPIPFYTDDRWPFVQLDFYRKPRDPWPIAPLAPGLGELKFINVMTSHLANRIWTSCRDFIAVAKSAAEDIKAQLEEGRDQSFLELSETEGGIDNVVKFLQQPQTNMDAWKILEYTYAQFDKRTGLSEILYGVQQSQSRSATDANVKRQSVSIRPDYMSDKCEEFLTEAARNEAFAARWLLEAQDVAPVLGQAGAMLWEKYITSQPIEMTVREIDYRVEHGTARKPDRERDANNINQAMQIFGPIAMQLLGAGQPDMMNYLIQQWGKVNGFDTSKLQVQPPPPPPEQQGPPPGAQREQAQVQSEQARMQRDQESHQAAMARDKRMAEQDASSHAAKMEMAETDRLSKVIDMLGRARESQEGASRSDRELAASIANKSRETSARVKAASRSPERNGKSEKKK